MIRKHCPEHRWTIEKYWEDYDMYMKDEKVQLLRTVDSTTQIHNTNKGANCPFDCGICESAQVPHWTVHVVV